VLLLFDVEEEALFLSLWLLRVESLSIFDDDDDVLLICPSYSVDKGMEALSFLSLLECRLRRLMLLLPPWRWLFFHCAPFLIMALLEVYKTLMNANQPNAEANDGHDCITLTFFSHRCHHSVCYDDELLSFFGR